MDSTSSTPQSPRFFVAEIWAAFASSHGRRAFRPEALGGGEGLRREAPSAGIEVLPGTGARRSTCGSPRRAPAILAGPGGGALWFPAATDGRAGRAAGRGGQELGASTAYFLDSEEVFDARVYHRADQRHESGAVPGVCETRSAGERPAWRHVPRARRGDASTRGRHPVPAYRGRRICERRGGEDVLPLARVSRGAHAPAGRRRLPHGDRRRRELEPKGAARPPSTCPEGDPR